MRTNLTLRWLSVLALVFAGMPALAPASTAIAAFAPHVQLAPNVVAPRTPDLLAEPGVANAGERCWATHDDGTTLFATINGRAVQSATLVASPGGTVKIAGYCAGTFADTNVVVAFGNSITLTGGYTHTNWASYNPVANPTTLDAQFTGNGVVFANAPATLRGMTVTQGTCNCEGGGIYASQAVTLVDMTVFNNASTGALGFGGGAYVVGAALISNTRFISNSANVSGGGAYFSATVTLTATQFLSNVASGSGGGGGIFANAALTDTNSLLQGNRATRGGGLHVTGFATLSGTRAIGNAVNLSSGGGGYFEAPAIFTATQFLDNSSGSAGGGVYAANAFTDTASIFRNNSAQGNGGLRAQGSAHLRGTRFELNRSTFDGGGAQVVGPLDMKFTVFVSNTIQSSGSGGGLKADGTLIDEGSRFSENRARSTGGGLRVDGVAYLSATHIVSNSASNNPGGGAYFGSHATLTATQVLSNNAGSSGGGICVIAALTDTNSLLRNNTTSSNGGGMRVSGAANLQGTWMEANLASSGGGAFVDGPVNLKATRFFSNSVSGGFAGGLSAGSTLIDDGSLFSGNESGGSGGGIFAVGQAHLSATHVVSNSSAFASGGGGYFASAVVLTATQFLSNVMNGSGGGGGLYAGNGLRDTGSLLRANRTGSVPGGGVYASSGIVNMVGSRLEQNSSDHQGGGIYVSSGQLVMRDSVLRDNRAFFGGGGIFAFAPVTLDRVQLVANRAQEGAALHLNSNGSSLVNSLLARNTPDPGKGVILISGAQVTMTHTTIASPTLANAIAIQFLSGSLAMTNTLIANHATAHNGGASVNERYSLFDGVTTLGGPLGVGSLTGTAAFVNPALDDYRLTTASAALDAGTPTSVTVDFEGQARPFGAKPDIGYDEFTLPSVCFARIAAGTVFSSHNAAALRQAAAAATAGSLVQVAGTCAGGIEEGGQRQVLRVDKDLVIEGGYTTTNWAASSTANPTVIDAENDGRVILSIAPLELRAITVTRASRNGDGGGIYAQAALTLTHMVVVSNTATVGGGLYAQGRVWMSDTRIANNQADFAGGARVLGELDVLRSTFAGNRATDSVGAVSVNGGGRIRESNFVQNQAAFVGALDSFRGARPLFVINTLFANNVSANGSSIINNNDDINSVGSMHLVHVTVAGANVADAPAVRNQAGTTWLTNTLIAHHTIGLFRDTGSIYEDYTLFDRVDVPMDGELITSGGHSLTGTANFVDEAGGNFRLAAGSAALDRGVDAGITVDFEGQVRPYGPRPDIGYDEGEGLTGRKTVMLPLVTR